ncbi:hypothetical protein HMPREF3034_02009 [Prevotella sp. DNF00663]|nr:hypothetical protein HMPREF3034_02009 [Prevotella sp. DNF00663]
MKSRGSDAEKLLQQPHPQLLPLSFTVVPAEPTATTRSMTDGSPKGEGDGFKWISRRD